MIGNDSDADLGYVSRHTHPVDVIRESFRIQRELVEHGYRITRYSALAFKVDVDEGDGVVRGLDVFGGFFMDGHLHLMGEIREPFEESWIYPLGTTTLEGRTFPAPADPDRRARGDVRRLVAGARPGLPLRAAGHDGAPAQRLVPRPAGRPGQVGPGLLAQADSRCRPSPRRSSPGPPSASRDAATYVDLGCGRGVGRALDGRPRGAVGRVWTSSRARTPRRRPATCRAPSSGAATCSSCATCCRPGAELARRPGPRLLVARHLVDTLGPDARQNLWRLARMALAGEGGGRLYLEFLAQVRRRRLRARSCT